MCPRTRGVVLRALILSRTLATRHRLVSRTGLFKDSARLPQLVSVARRQPANHCIQATVQPRTVARASSPLECCQYLVYKLLLETMKTALCAAAGVVGTTLEELNIENTFVNELPGDPETSNAPRQVFDSLYTEVEPTPVSSTPTTIAYSEEVCGLLGLDPEECTRPEFPLIFSGCANLPEGRPYAQCYGGHQFGNWAGQLGDGRAISIGEVKTENGRWELQLKGAGKTPYSRFADGRAVLRSSIREYVASEAMYHLGVPTTRALSITATQDEVPRDMFYNGDVKMEPGAVVCRVSPSFIRFGTFQLPVSRGIDQHHLCENLIEYLQKYHFPELVGKPDANLKMLETIVERTAELVAKWQLIGFVHGVLNTDNMSVLGLTIDYGPYGFLDKFDPVWTPNLTDHQGRRYCYKNQIHIGQWNCAQLGSALVVAGLCEQADVQGIIDAYAPRVLQLHNDGMADKLGLPQFDEELVTTFFRILYGAEGDFTNTFRAMTNISHSDTFTEIPEELQAAFGKELEDSERAEWVAWLNQWRDSLVAGGRTDEQRREVQQKVNPVYIPRQHLLQIAIDAANEGDYSELHRLMTVLKDPFTEQEGMETYASTPPAEMVRPGISMLSCSS